MNPLAARPDHGDEPRSAGDPAATGSRDGAAPAPSEVDAHGTGDPRVDAAVGRLDAVMDRPLAEQVAEYEGVHRALQDTLATVDEG